MPIGINANADPVLNNDITIKQGSIHVLGVHLRPNVRECEVRNWKDKIDYIKRIINMWRQRRLTLKGKSVVTTNLLLLIYYTLNIVNMPEWVENEISDCQISMV